MPGLLPVLPFQSIYIAPAAILTNSKQLGWEISEESDLNLNTPHLEYNFSQDT